MNWSDLSTQSTLERYVEQPSNKRLRDAEGNPRTQVHRGGEGESTDDGYSSPPDLSFGTTRPFPAIMLVIIDDTANDLESIEEQTGTSGSSASQLSSGDQDASSGSSLLQERWLPILCIACDAISAIGKLLMK
jgi:hypothetical protein